MERPDEKRMAEMAGIVMPRATTREFRRGFIGQIGAHRLENPEGAMDYARIFPDLFRRLRAHFFEERKRALSRGARTCSRHSPMSGAASVPGARAGEPDACRDA